MKVCGFSFIRNGVSFDYPFVESIRSALPICDAFYVAVGKSDDDTLTRVKAIDAKIHVIETIWDDSQKEGGRVFALETDKALQAIPDTYDWLFYIQGDEVLHEKYLNAVKKAMLSYLPVKKIDGLLFNYLHFFGSYDYVGAKYSWYRREIRIIRNNKKIYSYRDAQGFRKENNKKLKVKLIDAYIYHYGWVRNPAALQAKIQSNIHIYHRDNPDGLTHELSKAVYDYNTANEPVKKFTGTHPAVMLNRIARQNWGFQPDVSLRYASLKDKFKRIIAAATGWYIGEYRNYKRV